MSVAAYLSESSKNPVSWCAKAYCPRNAQSSPYSFLSGLRMDISSSGKLGTARAAAAEDEQAVGRALP